MVSRSARQPGRLDRYVRTSWLRAPEGVSRYRLSHFLEEALRLATLPGEEEGRIYCFRRISVPAMPAGADRGVWLGRIQQALGALAARAVHADDPHAGAVDSVYFSDEQEALETVLRRLIPQPMDRGERRPEWFVASFLGVAPELSAASQLEAALHRLRAPAMSAGVAAAIVLAAIDANDPCPLLAALPESTAREWLRDWAKTANPEPRSPAVRIPEPFREMARRAASRFGWRDSRTCWLALLILTYLYPTAMAFGNPVHAVRAALHDLEAGPLEPADMPGPKRPAARSGRDTAIHFDGFEDDEAPAAAPVALLCDSETAGHPAEEAAPAPRMPRRNLVFPGQRFSGEPTAFAGLYFLLNPLRRIGIGRALENDPRLRDARLVEHILRRAAERVGTPADDPILSGLDCGTMFDLDGRPDYENVWPVNLPLTKRRGFDGDYLLRVWVLALERWCWRNGRIKLTDIIRRRGRVWLTRADLDVTLPMEGVDIRVRRAGLDIDPGWLPWFGKFGKVVRFHYRSRDDGDVA